MHRNKEVQSGSSDGDAREDSEAPEGGWSWLIVVPVAMNKMAYWGNLPCFAIIFSDVLTTRPGEEGSSLALILATFNIGSAITAICSPAVFKRLSYRQAGTFGGLMYLVGSLAAAFSTSVTQLIITYGAWQGLSFGLMLASGLSVFNLHFRRRRTVAMGMSQCAVGAGSVALPLAMQSLKATAGSRAAKLAVSAFTAATAVSQLLLRPPTPPPFTAKTAVGAAEGPATQQLVYDEDEYCDKNEIHFSRAPDTHTERADWPRLRRLWALTGLQEGVVRDGRVVLVAAGVALVHVLESSFFAMLPLHLRALMDEQRVAQTITASTAGEFAGRVALTAAGGWLGHRNRLIYACAASTGTVAVLVLSVTTSWLLLMVLAALLGLAKGAIYITFFLTVAEIVSPAQYPSAIAITLFWMMIFSLTVSPTIGLVRDSTSSFPVCFRMLATMIALCPISWGLQAALRARSRRQRLSADAVSNTAL